MADERNRKSKYADTNDKTEKKERYSKKKYPRKSHESPQHKCSQTETTSVQHVAVQWENHATRDEDTTDTRTSDQSVQSMENNSGISDNQTANGSSLNMVNNKGPIQLGSGGTVIKNPTYNITNHHHYYPPHPDYPHGNHTVWTNHPQASLGPGSHHPGLPPPPAAQYLPATSQYPHSHHDFHHTGQGFPYAQPQINPLRYGFPSPDHVEGRGHPLNVYQSSSQYLPMLEQQSRHLGPGTLDPGTTPNPGILDLRTTPNLLPEFPQREQPQQRSTDWREQMTSRTDILITNTVSTPYLNDHIPSTSTHPSDTNRRENVGGRKSSDEIKAKTRPVPDDVFRDTVRIIDSQGQVLEPGDAVWIGNNSFDSVIVVYVGGQRIVKCVGSKPNLMVKEETLDPTSSFHKLTVVSDGQCPVFPRGRRVERAKERTGSRYTQGDVEDGSDFPDWVLTGLGYLKARRRGFYLEID